MAIDATTLISLTANITLAVFSTALVFLVVWQDARRRSNQYFALCMALFALYDALSKPLEPSRLLAALEYALAERRGDRPILVVNDNAADRDLIRRALKRQGYPVE